MGWLQAAWSEFIGLFVDDGSLAVAILACNAARVRLSRCCAGAGADGFVLEQAATASAAPAQAMMLVITRMSVLLSGIRD